MFSRKKAKKTFDPGNPTWEYKNVEAKLLALGLPSQETSDIEATLSFVAEERYQRADRIGKLLQLESRDVLLDLGSGMGFMAQRLAPQVHRLHCADISEVYLADCRAAVAGLPNVECHLIPYADFTALKTKGVSKVLCSLLFIHFNFYDTVYYLQGIRDIINPGGLLFIDFNDGDRFDLSNESDSFNRQLKIYMAHRNEWQFTCMHMSSLTALRHLLPQLGFEIISIIPGRTAFTELVLRRIG
ncbi:MAG: class I SAM-dependent methyltransferase [Hyphomicrobium sp.]